MAMISGTTKIILFTTCLYNTLDRSLGCRYITPVSSHRSRQHHDAPPILETGVKVRGHRAVRVSAGIPHNLVDSIVPWSQAIQGNRNLARNPNSPLAIAAG